MHVHDNWDNLIRVVLSQCLQKVFCEVIRRRFADSAISSLDKVSVVFVRVQDWMDGSSVCS